MAEIVNLRLARKRQARAEAKKQADENRAKYGRSKAQKQKALRETDKLNRHLDGHERDKTN